MKIIVWDDVEPYERFIQIDLFSTKDFQIFLWEDSCI